jgi:hypothetical protein
LNQAGLEQGDDEFSARINAYDLAFKMQTEAPEIFDLAREPKETARSLRHRDGTDS